MGSIWPVPTCPRRPGPFSRSGDEFPARGTPIPLVVAPLQLECNCSSQGGCFIQGGCGLWVPQSTGCGSTAWNCVCKNRSGSWSLNILRLKHFPTTPVRSCAGLVWGVVERPGGRYGGQKHFYLERKGATVRWWLDWLAPLDLDLDPDPEPSAGGSGECLQNQCRCSSTGVWPKFRCPGKRAVGACSVAGRSTGRPRFTGAVGGRIRRASAGSEQGSDWGDH